MNFAPRRIITPPFFLEAHGLTLCLRQDLGNKSVVVSTKGLAFNDRCHSRILSRAKFVDLMLNYLNGWLLDLLDLEGVDDPDGEVANEQEGNDLTTRLRAILGRYRLSIPFFASLQNSFIVRSKFCSWKKNIKVKKALMERERGR